MWTISAGVVVFAAMLHVLRRQPSVGEAFEGREFDLGQPRQVKVDNMSDRALGIASKLHAIAVAGGMESGHQPLSGIQPNPAIVGFKTGIVSDLQ